MPATGMSTSSSPISVSNSSPALTAALVALAVAGALRALVLGVGILLRRLLLGRCRPARAGAAAGRPAGPAACWFAWPFSPPWPPWPRLRLRLRLRLRPRLGASSPASADAACSPRSRRRPRRRRRLSVRSAGLVGSPARRRPRRAPRRSAGASSRGGVSACSARRLRLLGRRPRPARRRPRPARRRASAARRAPRPAARPARRALRRPRRRPSWRGAGACSRRGAFGGVGGARAPRRALARRLLGRRPRPAPRRRGATVERRALGGLDGRDRLGDLGLRDVGGRSAACSSAAAALRLAVSRPRRGLRCPARRSGRSTLRPRRACRRCGSRRWTPRVLPCKRVDDQDCTRRAPQDVGPRPFDKLGDRRTCWMPVGGGRAGFRRLRSEARVT